ncbi:MAG: enoyl-CoA hydratase-related protein [Chitinophagaceae bacterium]
MLQDAYVKSHNEHGITTIEFFHPQSNSLPSKILEELTTQIDLAGADDNTKVIILRSAGEGAFCAGRQL